MGLLENIHGPRDLDGRSAKELVELAAEIRAFLVANVSKTGGHLGPNLARRTNHCDTPGVSVAARCRGV